MTKIFLLFLLYSVVAAILKKRAAKKAAENGDADDDAPELKPSPPKKEVGRKTIDMGPYCSYKESGSKAPEAKSQTMRGRSVTTESAETDRDEHRRTQRGTVDWEAGEHAPSPSAAKKAGREVLDILARELGLPIPSEQNPTPKPAPAKYKPPVIPEGESTSAKKPARPTQSDEVRNSNWDGKRTREKTTAVKADDPYARQGFTSTNAGVKYASRLSAESLREPADVANAIVLQSLLGESPGMRYWKQRLHSKSETQP